MRKCKAECPFVMTVFVTQCVEQAWCGVCYCWKIGKRWKSEVLRELIVMKILAHENLYSESKKPLQIKLTSRHAHKTRSDIDSFDDVNNMGFPC